MTEQIVLNAAAAVVFVVLVAVAVVLVSMPAPRRGHRWDSYTYGDESRHAVADRIAASQGPDLSALDVLDGRSTWLSGKYATPVATRTKTRA